MYSYEEQVFLYNISFSMWVRLEISYMFLLLHNCSPLLVLLMFSASDAVYNVAHKIWVGVLNHMVKVVGKWNDDLVSAWCSFQWSNYREKPEILGLTQPTQDTLNP